MVGCNHCSLKEMKCWVGGRKSCNGDRSSSGTLALSCLGAREPQEEPSMRPPRGRGAEDLKGGSCWAPWLMAPKRGEPLERRLLWVWIIHSIKRTGTCLVLWLPLQPGPIIPSLTNSPWENFLARRLFSFGERSDHPNQFSPSCPCQPANRARRPSQTTEGQQLPNKTGWHWQGGGQPGCP